MEELQTVIKVVAGLVWGLSLLLLNLRMALYGDIKRDFSQLIVTNLINAIGFTLAYNALPIAEAIAPTLQSMPWFIYLMAFIFYCGAFFNMSRIKKA